MLAAPLAALLLAATHPIDVPKLFQHDLSEVRPKTQVPILLPQTMPSETDDLYPEGRGRRNGWNLDIGLAPDCGGSTVCFFASFTADRRDPMVGSRRVTLARGRHGRFKPLTCGASCSPPAISWRERGATYTIQARVGTKRTERSILVSMANSAIRRGPR